MKDLHMNDLQTNDTFATLARAGLRIASLMLEKLQLEVQESLNQAIHGGGRLVLEFGPLPAFEHLQLVLVEVEGQRHEVASVRLNRATIN